jgi:D-serine deaminase-like pyridoxal phosphate-dependent protein
MRRSDVPTPRVSRRHLLCGPAFGATIEFLASHCDPTVNLYSAFHVVRGEAVIDVWPIRVRY